MFLHWFLVAIFWAYPLETAVISIPYSIGSGGADGRHIGESGESLTLVKTAASSPISFAKVENYFLLTMDRSKYISLTSFESCQVNTYSCLDSPESLPPKNIFYLNFTNWLRLPDHSFNPRTKVFMALKGRTKVEVRGDCTTDGPGMSEKVFRWLSPDFPDAAFLLWMESKLPFAYCSKSQGINSVFSIEMLGHPTILPRAFLLAPKLIMIKPVLSGTTRARITDKNSGNGLIVESVNGNCFKTESNSNLLTVEEKDIRFLKVSINLGSVIAPIFYCLEGALQYVYNENILTSVLDGNEPLNSYIPTGPLNPAIPIPKDKTYLLFVGDQGLRIDLGHINPLNSNVDAAIPLNVGINPIMNNLVSVGNIPILPPQSPQGNLAANVIIQNANAGSPYPQPVFNSQQITNQPVSGPGYVRATPAPVNSNTASVSANLPDSANGVLGQNGLPPSSVISQNMPQNGPEGTGNSNILNQPFYAPPVEDIFF